MAKDILKKADEAVEKARKTGDSKEVRNALFEWGKAFLEAYDYNVELRPDNDRLTLGDMILLQDTDDARNTQKVFQKFVIDPETGDYMEDLEKAGGVIAMLPLSKLTLIAESFANSVAEETDSKKVT